MFLFEGGGTDIEITVSRWLIVGSALTTAGLIFGIVGAATILIVLFVYRTATTWPGLIIVLLGVPVYFAWRPRR